MPDDRAKAEAPTCTTPSARERPAALPLCSSFRRHSTGSGDRIDDGREAAKRRGGLALARRAICVCERISTADHSGRARAREQARRRLEHRKSLDSNGEPLRDVSSVYDACYPRFGWQPTLGSAPAPIPPIEHSTPHTCRSFSILRDLQRMKRRAGVAVARGVGWPSRADREAGRRRLTGERRRPFPSA